MRTMTNSQKPIIILVNDDRGALSYWKEELEKYLKAQNIDAEIREGKNAEDVRQHLTTLSKEGKTPAIIITDNELTSISGYDIARRLHKGDLLENQNTVFPEAKNIPVTVATGGASNRSFEEITKDNLLYVSNICLHSELNNPAYSGEGREMIQKFKETLRAALKMTPPQITPPQHDTKEKPLIVLINPDKDSRTYWRESLETYLKTQGVEADIREEGVMDLRESNVMRALDLINGIIKEGKRPVLLITDVVLGSGEAGGQIVGCLRRNNAAENQKQVWPEGEKLPAVIASGAIPGVRDPKEGYPNTLTCSCICLHDALNNPHYDGRGREAIDAFKKFVNEALGLPPPQISHAEREQPPADSWGTQTERAPEWRRPNRGG